MMMALLGECSKNKQLKHFAHRHRLIVRKPTACLANLKMALQSGAMLIADVAAWKGLFVCFSVGAVLIVSPAERRTLKRRVPL